MKVNLQMKVLRSRYYWTNYYELRRLTLYDFERKMPIVAGFDDLIE